MTSRAENTPQHIIACQGAAVKGNIPPGGIWEQSAGHARGGGKEGAHDAQRADGMTTKKLLIFY